MWGDDGAELTAAELAELRAVHDECTQRVQLDDGDVLVVDNLRVSHGREPWAGGSRKMGLLLSPLVTREADVQPPDGFIEWATARR